MALNLAKMRDH